MSSTKKASKKKKSFFIRHSKALRNFLLRTIFTLVSIGIFIFIVYKAYKHVLDPVDLQNIPLVKSINKPVKKSFNKNDGLAFFNQDRIVYDDITINDKSMKKAPKKILQDFSHQQIFDIVQDIKSSTQKSRKLKSQRIDAKNTKKKTQQEILKKNNERSVFQVLGTVNKGK